MTQAELELTPGAPITVATMIVLFGLGRCERTRVLMTTDTEILYGTDARQNVRREDEGQTWARGWDTEASLALEAEWILKLSA